MPEPLHLAALTDEPAITATAFLLLICYHLLLLLHRTTHPNQGTHAHHAQTRGAWARQMMQEDQGILAVQTLRNWTMAASFLASTAILLGLALLNTLFANNQAIITHLSAITAICNDSGIPPKLLLLSADFFFTFFNFTMAIRFYNHVGFMINAPAGPDQEAYIGQVIATVNRAAFHYTMGMRGYYLSVVLGLWLLGPTWLLAGAVGITATLWYADHTG